MSVVEVAELTGLRIINNSVVQVRDLITNQDFPEILGADPDLFNDSSWELSHELIAFTIHIADRITLNIFGPKGRSLFMDILLDSIISNLSSSILQDDSSEKAIVFKRQFLNLVVERTKYYSTLEIHSGDDAPMKGTLFWEAGRLCAENIW